MESTRLAVLEGTYSNPRLRLTFDRSALVRGQSMLDLVKAMPGRSWDPKSRSWVVTGIGRSPDRTMRTLGFEVNLHPQTEHESLRSVATLDELVAPMAKASSRYPGFAIVRHRLAGYAATAELLGPAAAWDKREGRFECHMTDLLCHGTLKNGLSTDPETLRSAQQLLGNEGIDDEIARAGRYLALHPGIDVDPEADRAVHAIIGKLGKIPAWFGYELYGYQRLGVYAAVAGHRLLADSPGLGKTIQALAALALVGSSRSVLVVPPISISNWAGAYIASGMAAHISAEPSAGLGCSSGWPDCIAAIVPGRKEPQLPRSGAVIVADSTLAARPELLRRIMEWAPDGFVYDEAHRGKNFSTARTRAVWRLAESVSGLRLATTGTPILSSMLEVGPILSITGQIASAFGGPGAFMETFGYPTVFGSWEPRKKAAQVFRQAMESKIWVRRNKQDVLKDLPAKQRVPELLDVDLTAYRATHREVVETVQAWVYEFETQNRRQPSLAEIRSYGRKNIGLISPLRRAAGLAKVPRAVEKIQAWMKNHPVSDGGTYDDPLIVWVHHHEVLEAMVQAVGAGAGVISGSTPSRLRERVKDDFQTGKIPVLVASIHAAGVSLTLTRGADSLFVESDWTPANVSQPEDRQHRIGQTRPVTVTTLVARGTLDERIQKVQQTKGRTLEAVMPGADNEVSVLARDTKSELVSPADLIVEIAQDLVRLSRRSSAA